ncbi:hypothetical protein DICVIV_13082 [Dictyocaulus viviparus]|uniref:Uncharacterized protein n=1 Tax=Dictyocaulus viviparus TaxID=29172 RepID=A0A0D8XET8_DICVI|nr:hypothetical protein DICVIV_13082 [Dictyocaulus viviparus]
MVGSNTASQATSPRSESYGPGVLQMVVDNVLIATKERRINAFCGLQIASKPGKDQYKILKCSDHPQGTEEKRSETNGLGLPYSYAMTFGSNTECHVGTPDFQITPYLVKGGHVIGGTATMQSSASGYGYGSWNVYTGNHPLGAPSNIENSQNDELYRT